MCDHWVRHVDELTCSITILTLEHSTSKPINKDTKKFMRL